MKILLKELFEARNAFGDLLGTPIDFKLAYRIRKIAGKVLEEIKRIEQARQDLFEKYAEKKEDGTKEIPAKKMEAFKNEFDEFLNTEVEISGEKIPFDCMEGVKISGFAFSLIEKFVEEPKAKPAVNPRQKFGRP